MHYDDSTRRRNLLSGLVLGAALGAGLALLLLPEDRLRSGGRIVVRAARRLGRDIGDGEGLTARLGLDHTGHDDGESALDEGGYDDGGEAGDDEDDDGDGEGDELSARRRATGAASSSSSARPRAARLARRRFEL